MWILGSSKEYTKAWRCLISLLQQDWTFAWKECRWRSQKETLWKFKISVWIINEYSSFLINYFIWVALKPSQSNKNLLLTTFFESLFIATTTQLSSSGYSGYLINNHTNLLSKLNLKRTKGHVGLTQQSKLWRSVISSHSKT